MTAAPIPFTPSHVSVNRVRIVDLPGIPVDEEVRGQLAYHLVSVLALTRYARERAGDLHLPDAFFDDGPETRAQLPRFLDGALRSDDAVTARAAMDVITRVGRNLGHVLLTLHRGDQENRAARVDWTEADWERWSHMRTVWLAGGLMSGRLGEMIRRSACEWLDAQGYGDALSIDVSPYAGRTSLVGAARYLPAGAGPALCFDFGQTSAKRAVVHVLGDAVLDVTYLPPAYIFGAWHLHPDNDLARAGRQYKGFVVDSVCEAFEMAAKTGSVPGPEIMLCVAAYVEGGRLLGNGAYATMNLLAPGDVRPMLAEAISARTGRPCRVHVIHDGTAAAAVFAGEPDTAVIALGTALGVGFAPATAAGLLHIPGAPASGDGTQPT